MRRKPIILRVVAFSFLILALDATFLCLRYHFDLEIQTHIASGRKFSMDREWQKLENYSESLFERAFPANDSSDRDTEPVQERSSTVLFMSLLCREGATKSLFPEYGPLAKYFQLSSHSRTICMSLKEEMRSFYDNYFAATNSSDIEMVLLYHDRKAAIYLAGMSSFLALLFSTLATLRLSKAPGYTSARITRFFWSKRVFENVFEPIIAELREDYFDAMSRNQRFLAEWTLMRNRYALVKTIAAQLPFSLGRLMGFLMGINRTS